MESYGESMHSQERTKDARSWLSQRNFVKTFWEIYMKEEVKTLSKLKKMFYWPGHYNSVRDWCQICKACAKWNSPVPGRQATLQTITAEYPTQLLAVDLLKPPSNLHKPKKLALTTCNETNPCILALEQLRIIILTYYYSPVNSPQNGQIGDQLW